MADMQPNLSPGVWINVPGRKAAALTSETVAVKNFRAELCGNEAVELERVFWRLLS